MPSPGPLATPRRLKMKNLKCWIGADTYALLVAECEVTPRGRHMGIGRVIDKCVFAVLGQKKGPPHQG